MTITERQLNNISPCELCGGDMMPPFRVIYIPTKAYVCDGCGDDHDLIKHREAVM